MSHDVDGPWKRFSEEEPPIGVFILVRHDRGTWRDVDDQEGCNYVVVKYDGKGFREFGPDHFKVRSVTWWRTFRRVSG